MSAETKGTNTNKKGKGSERRKVETESGGGNDGETFEGREGIDQALVRCRVSVADSVFGAP